MSKKDKQDKAVEEVEDKKPVDQQEEEQTQNQEESVEQEKKEDAPKTADEQLAEMKDKYIRIYSEFENFRRRTAKERLELISTAGADVIKDFLTVLDDFDRAIESNKNVEDLDAVKEGFELVRNKMTGILVGKGLKPMNAKGTDFDPELHEAVAKFPAQDEEQKGKVIDEVEKGYYLNEKIIRYSKVVVGE